MYIPMSAETEHQERVNRTILYFEERGIACHDYELMVGDDPSKRPDLLLPDFHTFIEVKTFFPQQREREEAEKLGPELMAGKAIAIWQPTFYSRFGKDLSHSRQKFRRYPDYHTAVIFYDLHSIFHEQSPEDLLLGQESLQIAFPKNQSSQPLVVGYERKNRQLRQDKSTDIGAVVFPIGHNTFKVFHNHFAEPVRKIDQSIFALPDDEHFEYIDDSREPRIVPLN